MLGTTGGWLMLGFAGQAFYTARFAAQWWASERAGASVVPAAFWWLSLCGGGALLAYAVWRRDPVIIFGQFFGLIVYGRNLWLLRRKPGMDPASP